MRVCVKIFWFPAAFFLLNEILNRTIHIYDRFPWIDIPMHAIGGMIVGYSMFAVVSYWQEKKYVGKLHPVVHCVLLVSLVSTIAVFWEFHEFIRDTILGEHTQLGIGDTMGDLFMGVAGGLVSAVIL